MEKDAAKGLFEEAPVWQAVWRLAWPAVASQLVTVLYSSADTYFIGRTGDPCQVAAANLCMPVLFFLAALASLFGVGGAGALARCLGRRDRRQAARCQSLALWASLGCALLFSLAVLAGGDRLLAAIGANQGTVAHCRAYLFWTVLLGAAPFALQTALPNLVRAYGRSFEAGCGLVLGALLNVVLDPIFISGLHMGVEGAALATFLSYVAAAGYFLAVAVRDREGLRQGLPPSCAALSRPLFAEIVVTGLPSALMCLMSVLSNIVLNRLLAASCNEAVAGVGIAKKIDLLGFALALGLSQGVLPLLSYNCAAGNRPRVLATLRVTAAAGLALGTASALLFYFCAEPLVGAFISDPLTVGLGSYFQKVMCLGFPCISITLLAVTFFQAARRPFAPLFLSCLRKGGLDVPCMLLMNLVWGFHGVVWATPVADFGGMLVALATLFCLRRRLLDSAAGL